jgi:hypothetical protein
MKGLFFFIFIVIVLHTKRIHALYNVHPHMRKMFCILRIFQETIDLS